MHRHAHRRRGTALFAATIALVQNDIKKVLAYSTVSSSATCSWPLGVGRLRGAVFHVMTHAFFKACLFLGLRQRDPRHAPASRTSARWAAWRRRCRSPFWTFLWKAFSSDGGGVTLWAVAFLVAGLTAFYMMRLVVLTFHGENRASHEVRHHIHESPLSMTLPLVVLAVLSVVGGWIGWPAFLGGANHFEHWLAPVFAGGGHEVAAAATRGGEALAHGVAAAHDAAEAHGGGHVALERGLAAASLAWGLLGLTLGFIVYSRRTKVADAVRGLAGGWPYRVLLNKYYVDEAYQGAFIRPGFRLSKTVLWKGVDAGVIDGLLVNGSALVVAVIGSLLRLLQNGLVRFYAWSFTVGVAVFVVYLSLKG
jgi:NADH-quinone oxidoreductase subunit L